MTTHCLEIRSTANWQDVRYRAYTTSSRKAEAFSHIPKIKFTDSGHGLVPVVSEGNRGPTIHVLAGHVREHLAVPKATISRAELLNVLRQQRAWVQHWADDVAAGLKPTPESLARALADIDVSLAKAGLRAGESA